MNSITLLGCIFIALICLCISIGIGMILKKCLSSSGASRQEIERGRIFPQHRIKRVLGYILMGIIYVGCFIHIQIMAIVFQQASTFKWMTTWLILISQNIFIIQPLKALFICLALSPEICLNPIAAITGIHFRIQN